MKKVFKWMGLVLLIVICVPLITLLVFHRNSLKISEGTPSAKYSTESPALLIIEKSNDNDVLIVYVRNEVSNWLINIINNSLARGSEGNYKLLHINSLHINLLLKHLSKN